VSAPAPARADAAASRGVAWAAPLLALLIALPPMFVRHGATQPARIMEHLSILTSQETWLALKSGAPGASWVIPTWNGEPRVNKPPLLVWMNLLAWSDLRPETADLMRLVERSRRLAVVLSLAGLLGIIWAGAALGDIRRGALAAAIAGTSFFFVRQARFASYDTHLVAWLALSGAAGVWAMQLGRGAPRAGRLAAGSALSGIFLAAAILTKGPLALLLGAGPMLAIALTRPASRARRAAGVALAVLAAAAICAPWYLHVLRYVESAGPRMMREYQAHRDEFQPPWYYLGLLALFLPWSLAMTAGLLRPREEAGEGGSGRLEGPAGAGPRAWRADWIWFVFIFVVMSIPAAKQQRYIAPIVPAAALLAADAWARPPGAGAAGRFWRFAGPAQWALLAGVAAGVPAFALLEPALLARGWISEPTLSHVPWPAWAVLLPLLPAAVGVAGRRAGAGGRWTAGLLAAAAISLAATAAFAGYAVSGHGDYRCRAEALEIDRLVGATPFYHLRQGADRRALPRIEFLMYTRRVVPAVDPADIDRRRAAGEAFFVAARRLHDDTPDLARRGLVHVRDYRDGEKKPMALYRTPQD
jgi:4-amino-4-deoxy-L-arabinose transferase-like glycosyltransferase